MTRLYPSIITLFLFLPHILQAHTTTWKADEYNESEYVAAMAIYSKHINDVDSAQLERYSQIADSVMGKGTTARNYAVQIVALTMKESIAIASGNFDEVMRIEQQRMEIARTHQNARMYFEAFYRYCFCVVDTKPSEAFFLAKQMVEEANNIGSAIGQMYSHMALGDICLMSRYDGHTAIDEYSKALQIASTLTVAQEKYFGIHMDLARAYMECNQYDNAQKVFDDAAKLECVKTPACKMRYYQTYIFLAQKLGKVNEFNDLYKKYIDVPEARTTYDEGSLLYFKFLWLTVNKKYAEALELAQKLPLERMRIEAPMSVYKEMGDYEKAFDYLYKLTLYDDSIQREISLSDIATMTLKMHSVEEEIQKAQASANRNLWITIAIGSLFAIVVCAHFVIVRIRRRRKTSVLAAQGVIDN